MPRILILHASVGSGHRAAAQALAAACERASLGAVLVRDVFDYSLPIMRTAYVEPYLQLTSHAPELFGAYYKFTDRERGVLDQLRQLIDRFGTDKLRGLVAESMAEVIICTHYLPAGVLSNLKGRGQLPQPLFCVITDYAVHAQWIHPGIDGYFVASEAVRTDLVERGVSPGLIHVTGIPVDPAAGDPKDVNATRIGHGFATGAPLLSFFGGGIEPRQSLQVVEGLLRSPLSGTLAVVAGRSAELPGMLSGVQCRPNVALHVLGAIDYVDDLLVASDLVITKAGGLIVAELLARGTPMLLTASVPGHEQHNADYVVAAGAGLYLAVPSNVAAATTALLQSPERLRLLRAAALAAGRPRAAYEVMRVATATRR